MDIAVDLVFCTRFHLYSPFRQITQETAGKITNKPDLEAKGKAEHNLGKVEKKVGQIEKVLEK